MATDWKDILSGLQTSDEITPTDNLGKANEEERTSTTGTTDVKRPTLTLFYEKKGRSGKPATIITGFNGDDEQSLQEADELGSLLKKRLGCGGSSRGGEILLQGDRREALRSLLREMGYRIKN